MTDEVLSLFIQKYIEAGSKTSDEITFGWQGGEPTLMGLEFYEKVIHYQNKFNVKKLKILNCLQTNGLLINLEWANFLKSEKFLVGISIDGPKDLHDYYRVDFKSQGSFDRVHKTIQLFNKIGVEYNTLTTVNIYNAKYPKEIYLYLKSVGSKFWQFIPIVERSDSNTLTTETVLSADYGNFLNGIFDEWVKLSDFNQISIQLFDSMLMVLLHGFSTLCVYQKTCGDCLVMEHNGAVYSCDHFVTNDFYLGNIKNFSFTELLNSKVQREFSRKKADISDKCKKCEFLKFCFGGCPKHRENFNGTKENVLCDGYRMFFSHSIKTFQNMSQCIRLDLPKNPNGPTKINHVLKANMQRNDKCFCGSGKKFKNCCEK